MTALDSKYEGARGQDKTALKLRPAPNPRPQPEQGDARGKHHGIAIVALTVELCVLVGLLLAAWEARDAWLGDSTDITDLSVGTVVHPLLQALMVLGTWLVLLIFNGAYSKTRCLVDLQEFNAIFHSLILGIGLVGFVSYVFRLELSRGFLLFALLLGLPGLMIVRRIERSILARLRNRGKARVPALVVGSGRATSEIYAVLARERWTGYDIVGAISTVSTDTDHPYPVPVIGSTDQIQDLVVSSGVGTVIVVGSSVTGPEQLREIGWALEGLDVELLVRPALTDIAGPRVTMRNVAGLPLIQVAEPTASMARGLLKRVGDFIAALLLITLLSPLLVTVALIIKLTDRGPVFFLQERIGVHGEPFHMIKFRSMVVDAEERLAELRDQSDGNEVLFKMKDDPRITRIGRFIRRFSIDELPQLFNVLKGDMSLVGPRPALPQEVATYPHHVSRRLVVPPGITGLWQVSGRSDLSWEESVRLDLYYVDNWSLMTDAAIIVKTVRAVLSGDGAY